MDPLTEALRDRIARRGPIPFCEFMEAALYDDDHGFYATGGRAGRRQGAFVTSPEVGPLFGQLVASYLDQVWTGLGRPDEFTVVDAGAGPGTLARSVLAASPACARALRYVAVERSTAQRARHPDGVHSRSDLPDEPFTGVIVANELLDNLPVRIVERRGGDWVELRVGWDPRESQFVHHPVSLPPDENVLFASLAPDAADGTRLPAAVEAASWVGRALGVVAAGAVVVVDYGATTAELAARTDPGSWLRTFRGHDHGGPALSDPGSQDITVDVPFDQLAEPDRCQSQADWLTGLGIDRIVDSARRRWQDQAGVGDLDAVRARSTVGEAEALRDPTGLGAFAVLEWELPQRG